MSNRVIVRAVGTQGAPGGVAPNITASSITDSTAPGRTILTAADVAAQRAALALGTAALLDAPASGDASSVQLVKGSDSRVNFPSASTAAITGSRIVLTQDGAGSPQRNTLDELFAIAPGPSLAGVYLYDRFNRANTSAGSLGNAESGGAWQIREVGGPSVRILNNQVKGAIGVTNYWYQTLAHQVTSAGAVIRFGPGNGGTFNNCSFAIGIGPGALYGGDDTLISNIIHIIITRTYAAIQVRGTRVTGTGFTNIARLTFPSTLPNDLTAIRVEFQCTGPRAVLVVADNRLEVFDSRIAALAGKQVFFEHFYTTSSGDEELFTEEVFASCDGKTAELFSLGNGGKPNALLSGIGFPNSSSYALANLTSITPPNSQSFSVWARMTLPKKFSALPAAGYIWTLNGSNTGTSALPQVLCYLGGGDSLVLWISDSGGTRYWQEFYMGDRYGGETVDIAFVFNKDTGTFRAIIDGVEFPGTEGTVSTPPTVAGITLAANYLTIGNLNSNSNFQGFIKSLAIFNFALTRDDIAYMQSAADQSRWQWTTNATLNSGSMVIGKTYRLIAVGTANYFYTGCAVGDRIMVTSATTAILISTTNAGDGRLVGGSVTMTTLVFNGTNTGRQEGMMVLLDGSRGAGNRFVDLSTNRIDAVGVNGLSHSLPLPPSGLNAPSMATAQRDAIASADNGTIVYVTDGTPGFYVRASGAWLLLGSGGSSDTVSSISYAASITPDLTAGNIFAVGTLTGNITINAPTGTLTDGKRITFRLNQDATGGRTITWNAVFRFGIDLASTDLSTSPSVENRIVFQYNSTSAKWEALGLGRF